MWQLGLIIICWAIQVGAGYVIGAIAQHRKILNKIKALMTQEPYTEEATTEIRYLLDLLDEIQLKFPWISKKS